MKQNPHCGTFVNFIRVLREPECGKGADGRCLALRAEEGRFHLRLEFLYQPCNTIRHWLVISRRTIRKAVCQVVDC